ncbi:MAG: hypothetical protein JSS55_12785 [Proteobacteria bacterium]|nr:hypothetical protein [Pseudomonadota bacterium]
MIRLFASLLVALGLAFAPAMMARVAAAPAPVAAMDHCKGAMPAKHDGKADARPCCSTACPMTAALPRSLAAAWTPAVLAVRASAASPVFAGLDPEKDTPPPRIYPAI